MLSSCFHHFFLEQTRVSPPTEALTRFEFSNGLASVLGDFRIGLFQRPTLLPSFTYRSMSSQVNLAESSPQDSSTPIIDVPQCIKFKRLDKTAMHIMQASDNFILSIKVVKFLLW